MVTGIAGAAALHTGNIVNAQSKNNPFSGLVQMIAQKFNLNQSQVQTVFDDWRNQQKANMKQNMQNRLSDRLDQAVKDGKINTGQKQAITYEINLLNDKYSPDSLKNMTPDQRRQSFQNRQADLKNWAQSQGIDLSVLMPGPGGKRLGLRHGWKRGEPSVTPTPT